MRAVHVERQQLAQRVPPVTIRQEPVPVRAQPVLEQLGERRVVLHVDHLGHLGGAGRRDDGRLRGLGGRRGRGSARGPRHGALRWGSRCRAGRRADPRQGLGPDGGRSGSGGARVRHFQAEQLRQPLDEPAGQRAAFHVRFVGSGSPILYGRLHARREA